MTQVSQRTVFATGTAGQSGLDSLTYGAGSLWAEYGNNTASTGGTGSSTIVQYSLAGQMLHSYSIPGSVDGLKIDPNTGKIYALQNQDGNSTLRLIDPVTGKVGPTLSYAVTSATRGYDDVAFAKNGAVYLSYTNPTGNGNPVVQQLANGNNPIGALSTSNVLLDGATGTNIATGKTGHIPLNDPDSLKTTPNGGLVLSSGADNAITLISNPGQSGQSERFVQLKGLPAGSSVDDVIVPGSSSGTFYVSNQGANQIEKFTAKGLNTSDAYASVGSEIVQVDLQTGATTPVVTGLSASHGLVFVPTAVKEPVVQSTKILATGSDVNATAPDSITVGGGQTWVEYGNGADSTGKGGSSTVVEYNSIGKIDHTYTIGGSVDGLKYNPTTGQVWALQN